MHIESRSSWISFTFRFKYMKICFKTQGVLFHEYQKLRRDWSSWNFAFKIVFAVSTKNSNILIVMMTTKINDKMTWTRKIKKLYYLKENVWWVVSFVMMNLLFVAKVNILCLHFRIKIFKIQFIRSSRYSLALMDIVRCLIFSGMYQKWSAVWEPKIP